MSTVTIEVKEVRERDVTTKRGPAKAYDIIGTDGTKYGFGFTAPSRLGLSPGTVFSADAKTSSFGLQIDSKTVTLGGTAPVVSPETVAANKASSFSGKNTVFPVPSLHGDMSIIRQNALTNAVSTVADFIATQPTDKWPNLEDWTDWVVTVAYKYSKFSSGHRELEAAKKLAKAGLDADELKCAVEHSLKDIGVDRAIEEEEDEDEKAA